MIALAIISLCTVVLLIGYNLCRHGELPHSISAMAYRLPRKQRFLWTLSMWAAVFTLTPITFEVIPDHLEAIPHAFATTMLLITLMPLVKRNMSNGHRALIVAAGIFSQACVIVACPWLLLLWPAAFLYFFLMDVTTNDIPRIFWGKGSIVAELLCYAALYLSAMIKYVMTNG